ncbi:HDIG domain-containing protein [Oceanobacillus halophilus]|uniref:HDIG domain-containing protein n=2 Tax=Oceanobacillus halophilus TaxID=930130 RepID=A0A495ADN5_9BACI|nr:HDIG domain-containing metalloprotein [Oceanobacillus halophilus]RKQ38016.1 HDIG domain-containing protein [Oceanobacillus halophilus]
MLSVFKEKKSEWLILPGVFMLGIVFFFLTMSNVHTETYDLDRFSIASETIRSPITIEDEQETVRKTRETVQSIPDRFDISDEITNEQINFAEEIFDAILTIEEDNKLDVDKENQDQDKLIPLTEQEKVQRLKMLLSDEISSVINDQTLMQLMQIPIEDREAGQKLLVDSLEQTLNNGVRTENLQSAISTVKENIKYSTINEDLKVPLNKLTEFLVVENSFFDVEQTMEARKEAASNVEPVVIRAGEVIVREGQTITNEVYENLELVGVLDKQRNVFPIIGLILFIILVCSIIAYELHLMNRNNNLDRAKIITVLIVTFLAVSIMKIVSLFTIEYNELYYIVPIATSSLLLKLLINERLALIMAALYAILGSIIFNGEIAGYLNAEAGVYLFFSQVSSIYFLMNVKDKTSILKSGFGITVVNIASVLLFIFLSFEKYALQDLLVHSGFAVVSAVLSSVLAIGLLPFFETGLNILSDVKLLQLSSPNQPLLKKILTEAPGTYHHSIMVANLSESACEAIGANGLLARVGAYYHDIGKTVKPHYFIENQLSIRNPHDFIDPSESARIIINHPYDGAELLKKYNMPKEIIDIAIQHHGTSLVKFFYYKEKENNKYVKESDFRYPGPKPQTKEAAIISISDSIEAAVRSLKEPTEEKIEEIVSSIIQDRMTDGQLDESPLTLKELKLIQKTTCEALKGIFHSRIQYPIKEAK